MPTNILFVTISFGHFTYIHVYTLPETKRCRYFTHINKNVYQTWSKMICRTLKSSSIWTKGWIRVLLRPPVRSCLSVFWTICLTANSFTSKNSYLKSPSEPCQTWLKILEQIDFRVLFIWVKFRFIILYYVVFLERKTFNCFLSLI